MGQTLTLKMAKPSKEDFERINCFLLGVEEMLEEGRHPETGEWIEDAEILEWIRDKWRVRGPGAGTSWRRVVHGGEMAIDNACDPNADVLEWKPEIEAAMRAAGIGQQ